MKNLIRYRPEIDGLRTIAVLSVIFYHAEFSFGTSNFLPGGFLGVDIFFVISGYLITSLILAEIQSSNKFSLSQFYERRARRLLPALLIVMLVAIPYSYKYLLPTQLLDYSKSIVASLLFLANIYWDFSLQEYGAESGALKPFLHTWSLAVEEQYYIFFPLLLAWLVRKQPQNSFLILSVLALVSLILAQTLSPTFTSFSFYQLPTRLWELLSGGLLAYLILRNKLNTNRITNWLPLLGLLMLVYSFFEITLEQTHPGFITLIPVIGTLLIIAYANRGELTTQLLSTKLFVGIGKISYSLYLWHYPVFAFTRIRGGSFDTPKDKFELIALVFVLSIATYYLLEQPFRNKVRTSFKSFLIFVITAITIILGSCAVIIYQDASKERFQDLVDLYGESEYDNAVLREDSVRYVNDPIPGSWFDEKTDKIKIAIIGNSHGKDLYNTMVQNLDLFNNHEFVYLGMGVGANKKRFDKFTTDNPLFQMSDVVILSNRYMPPNSKGYPGDIAVLETFIDNIHALGKQVIVLSNTPEFNDIEGELVFDWYVKNTDEFNKQELRQLFYKNSKITVDGSLNHPVKYIAKKKGVKYLRKKDYICSEQLKECDGVTPEGFKSFYDYGHYTLKGAKHFGKRIHELGWFNNLEQIRKLEPSAE